MGLNSPKKYYQEENFGFSCKRRGVLGGKRTVAFVQIVVFHISAMSTSDVRLEKVSLGVRLSTSSAVVGAFPWKTKGLNQDSRRRRKKREKKWEFW